MKRRLLIVLTIFVTLMSIYSAYAQEASDDTILGMDISTFLVMTPIIMIILGLLFFLGVYLKDHYKRAVYSIKSKFTRKKKFKEITKKATDYQKELQALQKRIPVLEPEAAIQHLSSLIKRFFAEKINLNYEFTHNELGDELEKVNPNWASLPKRVEYTRYSGEPLSKKEVNDLIKEFLNILKYERRRKITPHIVEKLKKRSLILEIGILKNLKHYLEKTRTPGEEKVTSKDVARYFAKRQKQRIQSVSDFFKKLKTDAVNEIKLQIGAVKRVFSFFSGKVTERRIDNMLDLLEDIKKQVIKGNVEQARIKYKQAYQLYYRLPIEEQAHIITELQELQQRILDCKPRIEVIETPVSKIKRFLQEKLKIKNFLQKKLSSQMITKIDNMIREIQKQVEMNDLEKAKRDYKQAYQIYYQLPIDEQERELYQLKKIKDRMTEIEKEKERLEIEELSKELVNLKSNEEIYIIFDKGDISKKLGHLTNYIEKVSEQDTYGMKAGKDNLKEKLKDLVQTANNIEKEDKKGLTIKEKKFLDKVKNIGMFFTRKESEVEKTFQETQKQVFERIHKLTQKAKIPPKPEKPPEYTSTATKVEPLPYKPPLQIPLPGMAREVKSPADVERVLLYLNKKKEQGLYDLKPAGKEFLDKIAAFINSIKINESKGVKLKPHEKEFLDSAIAFLKKDTERCVHPVEEEKRMLRFLEHMKEKEMVHIDEKELQKEKEKFVKPVEKFPKFKVDARKLKKLHEAEERVMRTLQGIPEPLHHKRPRKIHEEPVKKYGWEVMAEEMRKKKTRAMNELLKEEEDIQSKLRALE